MSLSKPEDGPKPHSVVTLPKVYGYLTIFQAGTAMVFTTFLVTHLSATALATIGGIELANKMIVLGRVYYQNRFLEPVVVYGAVWGHVLAGVAKRAIRQFWKFKKQDVRKLTGEVHEKVEKIVTDEKDERGVVVRQKITTKTTTTITTSFISRAASLLQPYHREIGYLLIPFIATHTLVHRVLPKRHFGDSSLVNTSYVTLSLRKWPRSSYFTLAALIGLTAYHVSSGMPAASKILSGSIWKKDADRVVAVSEVAGKRHKYIKTGVIVSTVGLLAGGLIVIGGGFGRNNVKIPLRSEYLKVYGRVYPDSWVMS